MSLIELKDIYKIYSDGDSEIRALDGVSLSVEKGEFVAIVGSSGSGKSTCMNIIGCLDIPTSGEYYLNGTDVSTMDEKSLAHVRNKEIGLYFSNIILFQSLRFWKMSSCRFCTEVSKRQNALRWHKKPLNA